MQRKSFKWAGMLVAAAALALPGSAAAGGLNTGVNAVKAHTDRADAALDRAVALWERNRDRAGNRQFVQSRRELRRAEAKANRLVRKARNQRSSTAAARAKAATAELRDKGVEELTGALDEVDGQVENRVAQAALSDTRGREKALAILNALLENGVPEQAETGILKAIAALSEDRTDEVKEQVTALQSNEVSNRSKRKVARAAATNVDGQARAAERLAALLEDPDMPEASKAGLQRAYDAVTKEQEVGAASLSTALNRLPASVRSFVEAIVTQAKENARELRENRPAPPTGGPGDTPPEETPPEESSSGAPEGTPSGQPESTPPESPGSGYRP